MSALSKRLDKLSGPDDFPSPLLVIAKRGEDRRDAIIRHGYDPDASPNNYLVVQFVSPEDVRHGRA